MIKQISVFLANQPGRIAEVTRVLADSGIDIIALSIADGETYGTLRMITDDYSKTIKVLKEGNFITKVTDVLGIEIPNRPGALSEVLTLFGQREISIEYIYAFVGTHGNNARVIIRVNDNEKALAVLDGSGIKTIAEEEVYKI